MKILLRKFALISLIFITCGAEDLFKQAPVIEEIVVDPPLSRFNPGDTVRLEVIASNPEEGALSYRWTVSPQNPGVFITTTDEAVVRWIAPLIGGVYLFKVQVSNDYKSSEKTKEVKVEDFTKPFIQINHPSRGAYLIQKTEEAIEAEAFHKDGLRKVILYVNDNLVMESPGHAANFYSFQFTPDTSLLGETEIKVEAIANNPQLTTAADSVNVFIEGINQKK